MNDKITRHRFMALDPARLKPHGDRVVVEKIEVDSVYVMGDGRTIEIAGTDGDLEEAQGFFVGRVLAIGSGHRLEADVTVPMPFPPDSIWMIERFSGKEIKLNGRKYRIVNQVDMLAHMPELEEPDAPIAAHDREDALAREVLEAAVA